LVTFEERSSNLNVDDHLNERKLRFWKYNQTNNQFELNTSITYPHGQETLNSMLFHPNKLQLATTGNDGYIKFWTFIEENPITSNSFLF
jgi:WD40 repeat protein